MLSKLPLPVSAALASIQWPLSPSSSLPPMYYEPLDVMKTIRERQQRVGGDQRQQHQRCGLVTPEGIELARDVDSSVSALGGSDHARVAVALLLLGNGMTDECHDVVTPLSWSGDTHFGAGPVRADSSAASAEASYAHSLVHRREGPNVGEMGMLGWSNANYWTKAAQARAAAAARGGAGGSSEAAALPHKLVREEVFALSRGNESAERWCRERIVADLREDEWEPRALHELCAAVVAGREGSEQLRDFAETAAVAELRVLIRHCLSASTRQAPKPIIVRQLSKKGNET